MSRNKKIIKNIVILIILFFVFSKATGLYLTPLSAHENSERSITLWTIRSDTYRRF